jgi:hypothetical protein
MSHYQNAGKYYSLTVSNKSFENAAKFKCVGTTVTNRKFAHKEVQSGLNSENACYHSGKDRLSCLFSNNRSIRIYKSLILSVILYGCEILCIIRSWLNRGKKTLKYINVRSFIGADCDTDHYPVVAKLRERLSVNKRARKKSDLEKIWSEKARWHTG